MNAASRRTWQGAGLAALLVLLPLPLGAQTSAQSKPGAAPAPPGKASHPKAAAPAPPAPAAPVTPLTPPIAVDAAEAAHNKRYDAAIAAVRDAAPSPEDAQRIKEAATAIAKSDLAKAKAARDEIKDLAAQKLVDWLRLRSGFGEAAELRDFLERNPAWPDRNTLTQRMEEQVFLRGGSAAGIKAFFKTQPPRFAAGMAALASAELADGDRAAAKALAAKAWREHDIAATLEAPFLERFGSLLAAEDHRARLDRLLVDDIRWAGERTERAAQTRRLLPLLTEPERKKAEARLAVFLKSASALQLITGVPADASDWGLAYHRAQALRRANKNEEAWKILLSAPVDPAKVARLDDWWMERRANAYAALKAGRPQLAYDLVRNAGPLGVNPLKDQTFTAGWIAYTHLKDPKKALPHFAAMAKAADGPLSQARAQFWLGRTYEALGDKASAQKHFTAGSVYIDTFHGQLCRLRIAPGNQKLAISPPAAPSPEETQRFTSLDAARAAVIARKAGLEASVIRAFLNQFRLNAKTESEMALAAHLAEALGDTQTAVRIGKHGIARGFNLVTYAYPVHPFPRYAPLRPPPETAFLLGIARQESEFNTMTVSGAGAKGLLQVMPVTAKHVCRDYKIKCELGRLLTDRPYNTMIASAYIADRMREFAGSYVLTLAGYNAGPGRARQWIREFGDPRDPKVDPIDWIERIPFQETREYVAKVLSNVQVYRARLGESETALRLGQDLVRARGEVAVPAVPEPIDTGDSEAATKSDG